MESRPAGVAFSRAVAVDDWGTNVLSIAINLSVKSGDITQQEQTGEKPVVKIRKKP
jgi:hypothetical protein